MNSSKQYTEEFKIEAIKQVTERFRRFKKDIVLPGLACKPYSLNVFIGRA